jgi:hypothetical protein
MELAMNIVGVDVSWMPLDTQPVAVSAATQYLEAELAGLSDADALRLMRAVSYAIALHGELSLRDMQMVCEVAAILRLEGGE